MDVIIADYMSEANMVVAAARKAESAVSTAPDGNPLTDGGFAFEATFLEALEPALNDLAKYKIKLAVNAGASDTEGLYKVVIDMIAKKGLASHIKVAWISGDEVLPAITSALEAGTSEFENIYTGETLASWPFEPIYAQAYLGGLGIAAALSAGADIVLCGRVSDASPVIGAAYWWHDWQRDDLEKLANALVAGHLIECSNYVCGGNFTGFKSLENSSGGWTDIGYPIAEISSTGAVIITKQTDAGGTVTVDTCTAQLLYEIQGPHYYNSDVTAVLPDIRFEQLSQNRVALHSVKALPPPPTTKVGITARGGFQAEVHWFLTGLDIPDKARMLEAQLRHSLRPYSDKFSLLTFTILGTVDPSATSQNPATVLFRVFVQARQAESLAPQKFLRPVIDNIMQSYPGATFHLDFRLGLPKPYYEYFATLLPQSEINHLVHIPTTTTEDGKQKQEIPTPPPTMTRSFRAENQPPSQPTTAYPIPLSLPNSNTSLTTPGPRSEEIVSIPLGTFIHARSGDKGPDCNVGFWVTQPAAYPWLRTFLSTSTIIKLLGEEYKGPKLEKKDENEKGVSEKLTEKEEIEAQKTPPPPSKAPAASTGASISRFELPNLLAVHFLFHNHLDRGVGATASLDFLGKNVAEFLRARVVGVPRGVWDAERMGSPREGDLWI